MLLLVILVLGIHHVAINRRQSTRRAYIAIELWGIDKKMSHEGNSACNIIVNKRYAMLVGRVDTEENIRTEADLAQGAVSMRDVRDRLNIL